MGRIWLEPVDETHRESLEAIRWIRHQVNEARRRLHLPERKYE